MNAEASRYKPPFVLSIDIGSTSVKAALYDADVRVVEGVIVRDPHPIHTTADGGAEEFPEHLVERVERVIDSLLESAGDLSKHIGAVGIDSMASTVLGVDETGQAITPIYTYADTRTSKYVDRLKDDLDVSAVYKRTGCMQHTSYLPARFLWLRQTCPDLYEKVRLWMDPGTFLYTRWFGRLDIPASYSIASWTGMLDRRNFRWDEALLNHLDVSVDHLPPLSNYSKPQAGLSKKFAKRWPALSDVPFFLVVGDGASANVGSGCIGASRVALTIGTSGAIRLLIEDDIDEIPYGLWAYRLGERTILGGAFSDGGSVFAWSKDTLNLPNSGELESELQSLPPDGHGLTVLPFWSGERSPGWVASARATIAGVSISTTPVQILQASLEAVAYRFAIVWELLAPFADDDAQIIANGGAITSSPYLLQLMADVLQHPVTALKDEEATARGTAVLALHSLGVLQSLDDALPEFGDTYNPNPHRALVYLNGIESQRRLYDALIGDSAYS